MAILIQQSPTTPNMANNTLVFSVTSSQVTQSQFQFVADLTYSGSNTVLQRVKQQPNPNARAVFDFGSIINNYLGEDEVWKIPLFATSSNAAKRFNIRFGEQYGTSVSSSVTLYTGNANITGSPAVSASNYIYIANGLVDPNDKVNWNFNSSSYYVPRTTAGSGSVTQANVALTNAPLTKSIQTSEYETIAFFNGNFDNATGSGISANAQDMFMAQWFFYDSTGSLIQSINQANTTANGGFPRTTSFQDFFNISSSQTSGSQLMYLGVGVANLEQITNISSSWSYYDLYIYPPLGGLSGAWNTGSWFVQRRYEKQDAYCSYPGARFAWKNEFGVWDYFTFTLQVDKAFTIERSTYEQSFVPFGDNTPVTYNEQRRGTVNYYNKPIQTQVANTDWLDQDTADWLKELFFSANVYYQDGDDFYPAVITSADVTEKTNPRTPLFQYTIQFQVANQINPRI